MIDPNISAHYVGDCRKLLRQLPDACVQTCITSPPYWGLRDYDEDGQIGLEDTPEQYVEVLVEVFEGVWRVLKEDGTLWLNLGDCYAGSRSGPPGETTARKARSTPNRGMLSKTKGIDPKNKRKGPGSNNAPNRRKHPRLKHKDLVGVPWMVAFALRDAGWYLRMDNIWSKPNPMPESVTDRTTKAHEYLFHLSKSPSYLYRGDVIAEPVAWDGQFRNATDPVETAMPGAPSHKGIRKYKSGNGFKREHRVSQGGRGNEAVWEAPADGKRNKRSVWEVPAEVTLDFARAQIAAWTRLVDTWEAVRQNKPSVWTVTPQPYHGAHFATFPPDLIEPCILACSRVGDLVLDPFFGTGTTGMVAERHERRWIGFDISEKYAELAKERTAQRSLPLARSTP